ncbi:MAG: 4-(cytidine 5'-diphospho)-2-C-methyl-D-erythritol kinase [Candidatus Omnitrophica bacterium]|nr:4-(cytidine 5'-diphospho)-2-C-methyl-D-erythritol kinase [Candidatus Omnitrophota bacterium]
MVGSHFPGAPKKAKGLAIKSHAKVNLYLEVLNKRNDNYHNIRTLFERIDLCDEIILTPLESREISVSCDNPALPVDQRNLAYRAAQLLQDKFRVKTGVKIVIRKRIPLGSGLGGGSSNAASTLLGLNKLWGLKLSRAALVDLARKLGADVPFFIYGVPFALGLEKGDKIIPVKPLCREKIRFWHVLAVAKIHVSTPLIYQKWDTYSNLTRPAFDVKLLISALRKKSPFTRGDYLFNSLEPVTEKLYPKVRRIKKILNDYGLKSVLMSGSGPAVFGFVPSRKEAVSLCIRLKKKYRSSQLYITRTI